MTMTRIEMAEEKDTQKLREKLKTTGFPADLVTPSDLIQEIRMREQAKQTNTLKRLTWWIFTFTLVVMISTLLQLAIVLKWIGQ